MDVKCMNENCRGILFHVVALDVAGNFAMDDRTPLELQFDGVDRFFACPHCGVKNVVVRGTSPTGVPVIRLARTK